MSNSDLSKALVKDFRVIHGKLFSGLVNKFGAGYIQEIEDAIQNAFLKALKTWKADQLPRNQEGWLFVVAKNDVMNQIKKSKNRDLQLPLAHAAEEEGALEDLRLKTLLFLAMSEDLSYLAKVLFILKNVFGLSIREISECTLLSEDAVYKNVGRARKHLLSLAEVTRFEGVFEQAGPEDIKIVEEALYAVFTIGFDSFKEKAPIVDDDLCTEALAIGRLLLNTYQKASTHNLLALFCFHLARIPAKISDNQLVPFFDQDRTLWSKELIDLGFHFLQEPQQVDPYYLEALITSKHMTSTRHDERHWLDVARLYELWQNHSSSPLVKLNHCYCLNQAGRYQEALHMLEELEEQLPEQHFYFSLVKAEVLKKDQASTSNEMIRELLDQMGQQIRRDFLNQKLSTD